MKKLLLTGLGIGLFSIGMIGMAKATPVENTLDSLGFEDIDTNSDNILDSVYAHYQNSGELMYVVEGNNEGKTYNSGDLESGVEDWLISEGLLVDPDAFILTDSTSSIKFKTWNDTLQTLVDDDPADPVAASNGTWTVTPVGDVISFYGVKAGNAYAMYFVNPADGSGSWSTFDIWAAGYGGNDPIEISHFTGYNSAGTPVPEPTTMLLFGTGLAGLVVSRIRKKKK